MGAGGGMHNPHDPHTHKDTARAAYPRVTVSCRTLVEATLKRNDGYLLSIVRGDQAEASRAVHKAYLRELSVEARRRND